jgi:chitinase
MSVTLTWTASTDTVGVTGYDVFDGSSWKGHTTTSSVTLLSLTTNQTYNFFVVAKDAAGNTSPASSPLQVIPHS